MATIKSYTDIEQSRKLAEILPLESADMHSEAIDIDGSMVFIVAGGLGDKTKSNYGSPIWSLSALLGVLPTINDEFEPQLHRSLDKYRCTYEGEEDSSGLWRVADNPVDACVAMIERLHELKML